MGKKLDITGQRFGKLVAIEFSHKNNCGKRMWLCKCDCGNYKTIDIHNLLRKNRTATTTCGQCQKTRKNSKSYKHGKTRTRIYACYKGMKTRCYNANNKRFYLYGGRGITVCDEWLGEQGSTNFINWALNNGYKENLTLDRIDNDKGYSPENCRWATRKEQSNNLRCNKHYEYKGKMYTASQICDIFGVKNVKLVSDRLYHGWSIERAINTPKLK